METEKIQHLTAELRRNGHNLQRRGIPNMAQLLFDAALTIDSLVDRIGQLDPLENLPVRVQRKHRRIGRRS